MSRPASDVAKSTAAVVAASKSAASEPSANTQPRPVSATTATSERELCQHDDEGGEPRDDECRSDHRNDRGGHVVIAEPAESIHLRYLARVPDRQVGTCPEQHDGQHDQSDQVGVTPSDRLLREVLKLS